MPKCPYCGEIIWYIEAFFAKNKKTYKCKSCKKTSSVHVDSKAFQILGLAEIIAVMIFVAAIFAGSSFCLGGIALIVFTFFCAYSVLPFTVRLFRIKRHGESEDDVFTDMKKESGEDTNTEIYSN